jgi:hypothetical protein
MECVCITVKYDHTHLIIHILWEITQASSKPCYWCVYLPITFSCKTHISTVHTVGLEYRRSGWVVWIINCKYVSTLVYNCEYYCRHVCYFHSFNLYVLLAEITDPTLCLRWQCSSVDHYSNYNALNLRVPCCVFTKSFYCVFSLNCAFTRRCT